MLKSFQVLLSLFSVKEVELFSQMFFEIDWNMNSHFLTYKRWILTLIPFLQTTMVRMSCLMTLKIGYVIPFSLLYSPYIYLFLLYFNRDIRLLYWQIHFLVRFRQFVRILIPDSIRSSALRSICVFIINIKIYDRHLYTCVF